jgi:hypothetical protein
MIGLPVLRGRRTIAAPLRCLALVCSLFAVATTALAADAARTASEHRDSEVRAATALLSAPTRDSLNSQIDVWVEQLGAESYLLREAAARHLLGAGFDARARLETASQDPHPEIRARARRLLVLIDQNQFEQRLEAFAADVDGSRGLTLPGWDEYRQIVGDDVASRSLFVEMQTQDAALLRAAFADDPTDLDDLLNERVDRLLNRQQILGGFQTQRAEPPPPLGSCAAILLVAAAERGDDLDRLSLKFSQLAQRSPIREATKTGSFRPQIRRLLSHWVVNCPATSANPVHQKLQLAVMHELTDATPLAVAVAKGESPYERLDAKSRGWAVLAVGRLAPDRAIEHLEPLLDDDAVCVPGLNNSARAPNSLTEVQIRDVSLAVLVEQSGQDLARYGFPSADHHEEWLFKLPTLGLESDLARSVALTKWRHWRASQEGSE